MAREFAKAFYNSRAWRKCRRAYIADREAVDGGLCEICRRRPGYIVHHTIWLAPNNINDPDVTLNHNRLMYVCIDCHNRIEEEGREPDFRFEEEGQLVPLDSAPGSPP